MVPKPKSFGELNTPLNSSGEKLHVHVGATGSVLLFKMNHGTACISFSMQVARIMYIYEFSERVVQRATYSSRSKRNALPQHVHIYEFSERDPARH